MGWLDQDQWLIVMGTLMWWDSNCSLLKAISCTQQFTYATSTHTSSLLLDIYTTFLIEQQQWTQIIMCNMDLISMGYWTVTQQK